MVCEVLAAWRMLGREISDTVARLPAVSSELEIARPLTAAIEVLCVGKDMSAVFRQLTCTEEQKPVRLRCCDASS